MTVQPTMVWMKAAYALPDGDGLAKDCGVVVAREHRPNGLHEWLPMPL